MNFHALTEPPPELLGQALENFEQQFRYPLGDSGFFHISHGRDYLPFFSAMGEASVGVAERDGEVLGTLTRVKRWLEIRSGPKGTEAPDTLLAHYLCDLKLSPAARGSTVLARIIREAKNPIESSETQKVYCVVMDGTGRLPTDYTGRLGVPAFENLGEIMVLRLSVVKRAMNTPLLPSVSAQEMRKLRELLPREGYGTVGGMSEHRSLMEPLHWIGQDGLSCGTIEDTRRGKRLFLDSGDELQSAHLSGFAYATAESGAGLLRMALAACAPMDLPALFVAVPRGEFSALLPHLQGIDVLQAPATVYGHGLNPGQDWWVDTAEI
ncbi:hypothetical protein BH11VER1_BH11VER1_26960 [soil metagenome]